MKTAITIIVTLFISFFASAQTKQSEHVVDELYKHLSKTPSYKSQIKGERKKEYQTLVERVKEQYETASGDFEKFYLLTLLFHPLKDNHLAMYSPVKSVLTPKIYNDVDAVKNYRSSEIFLNHPRYAGDLDILEANLSRKPFDDVEGIYYHTDSLKFGIFRTQKRDSLIGVILDTKLLNWDRGQLFCQFTEYAPNKFRAIYYHPLYKWLSMIKTENFVNGSFTESVFYGGLTLLPISKQTSTIDYSKLGSQAPTYMLTRLSNDVTYLRLGRFNTSTKDLMASSVFFHNIKDSLITNNLIVDLRNNGGGGFKNSKKFLKLLQKYKGNIYVLINNRTFSNAEEFLVELQKEKNVLTLGQQTNGTLTYGSNFGKQTPIGGGKYSIYLTDMKDKGGYLKYEEKGVEPEIILDITTDWVKQVMEMIERNK